MKYVLALLVLCFLLSGSASGTQTTIASTLEYYGGMIVDELLDHREVLYDIKNTNTLTLDYEKIQTDLLIQIRDNTSK